MLYKIQRSAEQYSTVQWSSVVQLYYTTWPGRIMYYTYYLYNTYNTVFCIVVPCVATPTERAARTTLTAGVKSLLNSRHGRHAAQRAVFCSRMQTPSNVQSSRPSWAASSALADVRSAGPASTMHCGRSSRLRSGQGASWRAGLTAWKKGPSAKIAGGSSSSWGGRRRPKALQASVIGSYK